MLFYLVETRYLKAVVTVLVSTHGSGGLSIAVYKDQRAMSVLAFLIRCHLSLLNKRKTC